MGTISNLFIMSIRARKVLTGATVMLYRVLGEPYN